MFIYIFSKEIGKDQFGNRYYESSKQDYLGRFRRQVIYKGTVEATKVPPIWHAWLHYMIDEIPQNNSHLPWQLAYSPNISGTKSVNVSPEKTEDKIKYNKWKPLGK
ncbi:NADH-ubiquinone oxidoreductase subunit NDUFA12 family protein [Candidatus Tisiphia endosymbiont of Nemotelus uliginosus]|uniref:NADH-ubiquinone oxidoreductase subunit NDUFA12 family protein n=1 Tax=Candidatus Tisiphia endosymbiont of Nemotelus uliginosus TaxID=3077926 RepID=UPI0035C8D536